MMNKVGSIEEVLDIANKIRTILLLSFPDKPNMELQCKRSSMLLDMFLKEKSYKCHINAGKISMSSSLDTRHLWNIIKIGTKWFLLDISLTQFKELYDFNIPEIVFEELKEASEKYSYLSDGRGKYIYSKGDVSKILIEKVRKEVL